MERQKSLRRLASGSGRKLTGSESPEGPPWVSEGLSARTKSLRKNRHLGSWTLDEDLPLVDPVLEDGDGSWRPQLRIIDPMRSEWLHKWDIINVAQLVAISFVWPYETAFLEPNFDTYFIFDRLCDVTLLVDMFIQFFTGYPDPRHPDRIIKEPSIICKHYLGGWFWVDLISVLPVDTVYVLLNNRSHVIGYLRFLRYFRVVRLVRLVHFKRLLERWSTCFGIAYAKVALLKLLAGLVLCCHWVACVWGNLYLTFGKQEETNWFDALKDAKNGPNLTEDDHFGLYTLALYWAVITITSIGYGDITPQSLVEYRVATACSCLMAGLWAYGIGAICGIVATLDPHESYFKRTMDDLNWIMQDRDMPNDMRQRLRKYFCEAREVNKQQVEQGVITQMSPLLQGEVAMFMHSRWLSKVWYLRSMNREIIVWAARNLTVAVFAPNEEVLEERTLFIVQRGVVAYKGKILVSGDIWGEDMLLSNAALREQGKARALSHVCVLSLHIVDLFEIVVCFSEARAVLRWAQIQIAIQRGIVLLARKIKELKGGQAQLWDLGEHERADLYRDLLANLGSEQSHGDDFGFSSRHNTLHSLSTVENALVNGHTERHHIHCDRNTHCDRNSQAPPAWEPALAELTASVQEIKNRLISWSMQVTRKHSSEDDVDFGPALPRRRSARQNTRLFPRGNPFNKHRR